MKIEIKKQNHQCEYTLTRANGSMESITLDTKTYLLHDICHFAVEKHLKYPKGFWGMLAQGHAFLDLFGKDNPQTTELRFIEQMVGPVQSVHSGHIPKQDLGLYIEHLDSTIEENVLDAMLAEIGTTMAHWEKLEVGQQLTLEWNL
ncbi:hypothetical protein [Sinomicrobium oceani]|uniref:hypothetical protein n=1 Tax=Sinomicrobium oceani TaxID=1150368 RepID=UPI00227D606E|nr:hypothetical protein [Sinomicrobium oceani]